MCRAGQRALPKSSLCTVLFVVPAVAIMGCGALCRTGGKAFEVDTTVEKPTSEARLEYRKLEEELFWLRSVFEKEKAEKSWIMQRYERVENDLCACSQQASQLRLQIETLRSTAASSSSGHGLQPSTASAVQPSTVQAMPGTPAVSPSSTPSPARSSSPPPQEKDPPLSPGGMSLKARRGLSLTVKTGSGPHGNPTAKPAENVQGSPSAVEKAAAAAAAQHEARQLAALQAVAPQPLRLQPAPAQAEPQAPSGDADTHTRKLSAKEFMVSTKKDDFLASLHNSRGEDDEPLVEPMTAKASIGRNSWGGCSPGIMEPMSPLLRRRIGGNADTVRNRNNKYKSSPGSLETMGLRVASTKISKLELVPPSPKRIPPPPGKRKMYQDAQWEPIHETEEELTREAEAAMKVAASCPPTSFKKA